MIAAATSAFTAPVSPPDLVPNHRYMRQFVAAFAALLEQASAPAAIIAVVASYCARWWQSATGFSMNTRNRIRCITANIWRMPIRPSTFRSSVLPQCQSHQPGSAGRFAAGGDAHDLSV
jgi:hypothetical protein